MSNLGSAMEQINWSFCALAVLDPLDLSIDFT